MTTELGPTIPLLIIDPAARFPWHLIGTTTTCPCPAGFLPTTALGHRAVPYVVEHLPDCEHHEPGMVEPLAFIANAPDPSPRGHADNGRWT